MTNFVQEANYSVISNSNQREDFDISNSNQGDLTNMAEEDYWYSVEKDRYKEQLDEEEEEYWYSVEKDRYKEQLADIFENLRKEYGANLSNDVHELVVVATLNLIEHYKDKQIIKLDDNEKMICDIYPKISAFLN